MDGRIDGPKKYRIARSGTFPQLPCVGKMILMVNISDYCCVVSLSNAHFTSTCSALCSPPFCCPPLSASLSAPLCAPFLSTYPLLLLLLLEFRQIPHVRAEAYISIALRALGLAFGSRSLWWSWLVGLVIFPVIPFLPACLYPPQQTLHENIPPTTPADFLPF